MIARATLALILAGPVLASGLLSGSGNAAASTLIRKAPVPGTPGSREKTITTGQRRGRGHGQFASHRSINRDQPAAVVATFDDGLAYDTPRDNSGHPLPDGELTPDAVSSRAWQVGTASWYGGAQWQGRRMSDGTRYEQNQLTAAHLTLPLGSRVRVTLANSSRSVVVRITDRPGTHKRIIDLSRGAAAELGILSAGVATVRLDPL